MSTGFGAPLQQKRPRFRGRGIEVGASVTYYEANPERATVRPLAMFGNRIEIDNSRSTPPESSQCAISPRLEYVLNCYDVARIGVQNGEIFGDKDVPQN